MGDRGQIKIKDTGVFLYTHWRSSNLIDNIKSVIRNGNRLDDIEYLTRILFCEMIGKVGKEYFNSTTGFGIGTEKHGDINRLITINIEKQEISIEEYDEEIFKGSFDDLLNYGVDE